jgi:hypothetical protein
VHLNDHHRDTLKKIFSHSSSDNIAWRHVFSLLNAVGAATEEHNGKVRVTLAPETEVLRPPHGKDVDEQTLVDLRRMLRQAGFGPEGDPAIDDERLRDHGDGQRGEQSAPCHLPARAHDVGMTARRRRRAPAT